MVRRLPLCAFVVACVSAAAGSVADAHEAGWHFQNDAVFDSGGDEIPIHWDVTSDGVGRSRGTAAIDTGTSFAYTTCFRLVIDEVVFQGASYTSAYDGRGLVTTEEEVLPNLLVSRKVYVPASGLDFVRYVDTFRNESVDDTEVTVEYQCFLGTADEGDEENFSSDGDEAYETSDVWVGSDNTRDARPAVAFALQSEGSPVTVASFPFAARGSGRTFVRYTLPIAAGETVALMQFGMQAQDEAEASALAGGIAELPNEALLHLDDDAENVVNWQIRAPGAPLVLTHGPYTAPEWGSVRLAASVTDLEGDPVTFGWDLDADGAFDDSALLDPEVSTVGVDGTVTLPIALRATDGTHEVIRRTVVRVENVAPVVTSTPPTSAVTSQLYNYQVTATDPAGLADPLQYEIEEGPPGMRVSTSGLVTWTPALEESTQSTWEVVLSVHDDDNGVTEQSWSVALGGAPHVVVPDVFEVEEGGTVRMRVEVTDDEGDEVTVTWDVNRDGDFTDATGLEADYSADGVNGPADDFARVRATDGQFEVVVRVDVEIENAPPIFDSTPEGTARTGAVWRYEIQAHDPGGDEFEIEVEEDDLPRGMTFDEENRVLEWPVEASQLAGSPYEFRIRADDDDDTSRQDVNITVIENFPPSLALPVYPTPDQPSRVLRPTLKASNATDLDGDTLVYFFELDADPAFRGLAIVRSAPEGVPAGPGITEWTVPRDLADGTVYYWRVWANDGIEDGEKMVQIFRVQTGEEGPEPEPGDDGPNDDDGAGCACSTSATAPGLPPVSLVFAGAVVLAATRRRSS